MILSPDIQLIIVRLIRIGFVFLAGFVAGLLITHWRAR